jgi:hypothetical protein
MNTLETPHPKHAEGLAAVDAAVEARSVDQLETLYVTATDIANRLHAETSHPYVRWVLPAEPSQGLQLEPVPLEAEEGVHP